MKEMKDNPCRGLRFQQLGLPNQVRLPRGQQLRRRVAADRRGKCRFASRGDRSRAVHQLQRHQCDIRLLGARQPVIRQPLDQECQGLLTFLRIETDRRDQGRLAACAKLRAVILPRDGLLQVATPEGFTAVSGQLPQSLDLERCQEIFGITSGIKWLNQGAGRRQFGLVASLARRVLGVLGPNAMSALVPGPGAGSKGELC